MKHNLETLKYKLERFPETVIPYEYLLRLMKELREMTLRKSRFDKPNMDFVQMIRTSLIKEILGDV